jgi:hypothetical protein
MRVRGVPNVERLNSDAPRRPALRPAAGCARLCRSAKNEHAQKTGSKLD